MHAVCACVCMCVHVCACVCILPFWAYCYSYSDVSFIRRSLGYPRGGSVNGSSQPERDAKSKNQHENKKKKKKRRKQQRNLCSTITVLVYHEEGIHIVGPPKVRGSFLKSPQSRSRDQWITQHRCQRRDAFPRRALAVYTILG